MFFFSNLKILRILNDEEKKSREYFRCSESLLTLLRVQMALWE